MEPCRSLALLTSSLGLASLLLALSTDFWFVAEGPNYSSHSGLWSRNQGSVEGYIRVTQSFCILAVLWGLISVSFLVMSCIPSLSAPGRGPIVSTFMAFAAGKDSGLRLGRWDLTSFCGGAERSLLSPSPALSLIVAMVVYTIERWNQPGHSQIQSFFSWSFYMGWVSTVLFLSAGDCCPGDFGGWMGAQLWALREQGRSKCLISLCYSRWPESGSSLQSPAAGL
ncbi:protein NKG7 isoform X1 [Hippopotamus amphibius kiboko]|uniref:protein NKG7 isoform X1 n=1 Tax=Hippopotamus amphibius kiboko TaxID=575201 RepID=UPI002592F98D|nr:protein NKG7 isoform X1 [Hippopotamus amphibius kiboko]